MYTYTNWKHSSSFLVAGHRFTGTTPEETVSNTAITQKNSRGYEYDAAYSARFPFQKEASQI